MPVRGAGVPAIDRPHWGHAGAWSETSRAQSGQRIKAICQVLYQAQLTRKGHDGLGAAGEWQVDHAPVDQECTRPIPLRGLPGLDDAQRAGNLLIGRPKDIVGQRDLAGMDA
jgi:hypothetical protein